MKGWRASCRLLSRMRGLIYPVACALQVMGFGCLLVLFLACGLAYGPLTGSAAGLRGFQTLYFISSFFAQFGPNATTFLVVRASPWQPPTLSQGPRKLSQRL